MQTQTTATHKHQPRTGGGGSTGSTGSGATATSGGGKRKFTAEQPPSRGTLPPYAVCRADAEHLQSKVLTPTCTAAPTHAQASCSTHPHVPASHA